jgi:hypothetical protein
MSSRYDDATIVNRSKQEFIMNVIYQEAIGRTNRVRPFDTSRTA